jgi:phosphoenolpyruvate carboxykinase (ATP)
MTAAFEAQFAKAKTNLSRSALIEAALNNQEGEIASNGALTVETGSRTGRSPKDRFIVKDDITANNVDWGIVNQPIELDKFEALWEKATAYLKDKDVYVSHLKVGADDEYALPVTTVTEFAWHSLFVKNLFVDDNSLHSEKPVWRLLNAATYQANPKEDGVNSDAAVMIDFTNKRVLVCGTQYAGEMKKAMFSILNFLLTDEDVLPMHCAANMSGDGEVALFFGLSGTGKTTLSSDPERFLIGDDEHGWSKDTVFNFEGGCYAKCINLSKKNEPVIWDALRGETVMENVVLNPKTKEPDFTDDSLTQNSRAAYPRDYIEKRVEANMAGTPTAVVFLTCDLYGVLPPVSKLTKEQAAYHFLSGYTALVGSTEVGQTEAVKPTFSTCFGAPFFPRAASIYADLLIKRSEETQCPIYLVNTGWTGGAYAQGGKRFDIPVTRAIIRGILTGELAKAEFETLSGFDLSVPKSVHGVDAALLNPKNAWKDPAAYEENLHKLIEQFIENFKKFKVSDEILEAGPSLVNA